MANQFFCVVVVIRELVVFSFSINFLSFIFFICLEEWYRSRVFSDSNSNYQSNLFDDFSVVFFFVLFFHFIFLPSIRSFVWTQSHQFVPFKTKWRETAKTNYYYVRIERKEKDWKGRWHVGTQTFSTFSQSMRPFTVWLYACGRWDKWFGENCLNQNAYSPFIKLMLDPFRMDSLPICVIGKYIFILPQLSTQTQRERSREEKKATNKKIFSNPFVRRQCRR